MKCRHGIKPRFTNLTAKLFDNQLEFELKLGLFQIRAILRLGRLDKASKIDDVRRPISGFLDSFSTPSKPQHLHRFLLALFEHNINPGVSKCLCCSCLHSFMNGSEILSREIEQWLNLVMAYLRTPLKNFL